MASDIYSSLHPCRLDCQSVANALLSFKNITSIGYSPISPLSPKAINLANIDNAFQEYELLLDNKYYSATINIWVQNVEELNPVLDQSLLKDSSLMDHNIEGIILAFNCHGIGMNIADQILSPWVDLMDEMGTDSVEFKLIAAIDVKTEESSSSSSTTTTLSTISMPALIEWGLDHFYEVVGISSFDSNYIKIGSLEREKVGIPRIIEAAEATPWSSMQRKENKIHQNKSLINEQQNTSETNLKDINDMMNTQNKPHEEEDPHEDKILNDIIENESSTTTSLFSIGETVIISGLIGASQYNGCIGEIQRYDDEEKRYVVKVMNKSSKKLKEEIQEGNNQKMLNNNKKKSKFKILAVKSNNLQSHEVSSQKEGGGDAVNLESLEKVIDEAKLARHAASQGSVSDEVRRNKAAETALKMLTALGMDGDETESDSDASS